MSGGAKKDMWPITLTLLFSYYIFLFSFFEFIIFSSCTELSYRHCVWYDKVMVTTIMMVTIIEMMVIMVMWCGCGDVTWV